MNWLLIILFIAIFVIELFGDRIEMYYFRKNCNKANGKELDRLIQDNYKLKREGFGPWWFLFAESDEKYSDRAHKHLMNMWYTLETIHENPVPPWL